MLICETGPRVSIVLFIIWAKTMGLPVPGRRVGGSSSFGLAQFEPDLSEDSHEELVHVVVYADGHFDEFTAVGARYAFPV